MVMGALDLAGVTSTLSGYRISPHFPFANFSVRFPIIGVSGRSNDLSGYVRPLAGGSLLLQVAVPRGAARVTAEVDGTTVRPAVSAGWASLRVRAVADQAVDWSVSWQAPPRRVASSW
jgi:hypothetical protein